MPKQNVNNDKDDDDEDEEGKMFDRKILKPDYNQYEGALRYTEVSIDYSRSLMT